MQPSADDNDNLNLRDVLRLHALTAPSRLVGHLVAVLQELISVARYVTVVHEDAFASVVRYDETVAYLGAVLIDSSLGHTKALLSFYLRARCPFVVGK